MPALGAFCSNSLKTIFQICTCNEIETRRSGGDLGKRSSE